MLEFSQFNSWKYGTPIWNLSLEKINIGVFNPEGIRKLLKKDYLDVDVYYIQASDKARLLRQLSREKNPNVKEIIRRFNADEEQFKDLEFSYKIINNEEREDLTQAIQEILDNIN
jgi:guanylate kinase